jgi:hypothetical protein
MTEGKDPNMLDTLAAAYAAGSDFDAARNTVRAAIDAATTRGQSTDAFEKHLARYEAGQPVIDRALSRG